MTRARQVDGPTSLYKCYANDGDLIYVGITFSVSGRLKGHEYDKLWWNEVARIEIEHHHHRAAASAEEQRLIRAYLPKYNNCRVADAERARRQGRIPKQPSTASRTTSRRRSDQPIPSLELHTPFGHRVMKDGRVYVYAMNGPGWGMSMEDAWRRYGASYQPPAVVIEHDEPPVEVVGGSVIGRAGFTPVERFCRVTIDADGEWETRLEPDGKWRTRLIREAGPPVDVPRRQRLGRGVYVTSFRGISPEERCAYLDSEG